MGLLSGDSGDDKKEEYEQTDKEDENCSKPSSSGAGVVETIQKQGAQVYWLGRPLHCCRMYLFCVYEANWVQITWLLSGSLPCRITLDLVTPLNLCSHA